MASSFSPSADAMSEADEEVSSFRIRDALEKRVQFMDIVAEVGPVCPIANPDFGSLSHDPAGTVLLRSKVKTSESSAELGVSIFHKASCWRGKSVLNLVRN